MKNGCLRWILVLLVAFPAVSANAAGPSPTAQMTRIAAVVKLAPRCPTSTNAWKDPSAQSLEFGPLAVAVAPLVGSVAQIGVDVGLNWIKERRDQLSKTISARDDSTFYFEREPGSASARNGCLIFIRGELGSDTEFLSRQEAKKFDSDPVWNGSRIKLLRNGWENERVDQEGDVRRGRIPLVAPPLFYAEFSIRYDNLRQAKVFYLKPNFIDYRATGAERTSSGTKDLVFSFIFEAMANGSPSASPAASSSKSSGANSAQAGSVGASGAAGPGALGATSSSPESSSVGGRSAVSDTAGSRLSSDQPKVAAKFDIVLMQTPIGSRFEAEALGDIVSALQPLPAWQSPSPGLSGSINLVPVSVLASLTETEKAGSIELLLDSSISENKDNLSKTIGDLVTKFLQQSAK
jgi:hypothetical protein